MQTNWKIWEKISSKVSAFSYNSDFKDQSISNWYQTVQFSNLYNKKEIDLQMSKCKPMLKGFLKLI